jgi:hypothetical protein
LAKVHQQYHQYLLLLLLLVLGRSPFAKLLLPAVLNSDP